MVGGALSAGWGLGEKNGRKRSLKTYMYRKGWGEMKKLCKIDYKRINKRGGGEPKRGPGGYLNNKKTKKKKKTISQELK